MSTTATAQPRPRLRIADRPGPAGISSASSRATSTTRIQALFGGVPVGYSHRGEDRNPIEIVGRACRRAIWPGREQLASTPVPANALPGNKAVVELGEVVQRRRRSRARRVIFRRDGHFADMVTAELAGAYEAPIYGMLAVDKRDRRRTTGASCRKPAIRLHGQPDGRVASRRCCGTANGRSPTSPSATWARRSASRSSASTSWWSRSSAASSCRW